QGNGPVSRFLNQPVNLGDLDSFKDGATVDNAALAKAGLVKNADERVKLLPHGELTKKLTIKVQAASAAAKAAVEKAGGTLEIADLPRTPSKKATRPAAPSAN
ncbi:MAG TPA: uL15m family ribosomal protein, partial [Candidatus Saccharimonas sp.]|nr:uL15m family ribosomal protein [Candidatus Saccharimonas sp.]